ncbi:MAG: radical SAM protein [Desulfomonilaceae bacterium]|nr:radical SAM protein [Desulfomonilaceae bacterium]
MNANMGANEIRERAREARRLSSPCRLCPRMCGVDRAAGDRGYCGAGPIPRVAAVIPHFGEEPPICGRRGAGTIFLSHCNLRCVYCQNHQISRGLIGAFMSPEVLATHMMELQRQGCAVLEPVSPTHHLPGLLEALALAKEQGLELPLVYNTNGYETAETLDLLEGIVDVYLPDLKYADSTQSLRCSDSEDYVDIARAAVLRMHAQVGNLVVNTSGTAVRGMILRLLVLPNGVAGTETTLAWIRAGLPLTVTISLMSQYSPLHRSADVPELNRRLFEHEYDGAMNVAWEMGFENVFIQDMDASEVGIPDFALEKPFLWD